MLLDIWKCGIDLIKCLITHKWFSLNLLLFDYFTSTKVQIAWRSYHEECIMYRCSSLPAWCKTWEKKKLKKMNFLENELIPPIIDHRPLTFWNVEKRSILGNDTCNFFAPFLRNFSWKMIFSICKLHDCRIKFDTLPFVKHSLCNISIPKCVFQKWPCIGEILN